MTDLVRIAMVLASSYRYGHATGKMAEMLLPELGFYTVK
jgi:hypothetical protein